MAINDAGNSSKRDTKYETMNLSTIVKATDKEFSKPPTAYELSNGATFPDHKNPYENFD